MRARDGLIVRAQRKPVRRSGVCKYLAMDETIFLDPHDFTLR